MVGYIDDAAIETQVRLRFDAGFHDTDPDRAEFFYAKCGCYADLFGNPKYDPNAPGPGPGIAIDVKFQQAYVDAQYAFMGHLALFAELPVRWLQPQTFSNAVPGFFSSQSGISDVRAGAKVALVSSAASTVTVQLQGYFPSGDASKGLGTHHSSVEPALLYYQRVADRVAIESQFGDWHPIGGSAGVPVTSSSKFAGDVLFYGVGPSFEIVRTDRISFAPVVELVGWHVTGGYATVAGASASGTNIVNLKVGARTTLSGGSSVYAGYGRALTTSSWYKDILRVEYRYSF